MSSGFTWKRKANEALPRAHVDRYDGMLFGPASFGSDTSTVRNVWYDTELMRNLAATRQEKRNIGSHVRNIISAARDAPLSWKRIKLTLGSGLPGAAISAGVKLGLIGREKRLRVEQDIQKNIQQSGFIPAANGKIFTSAQDGTAEDILVQKRAGQILDQRATARRIRNNFLRQAGPKLLERRRQRLSLARAGKARFARRRRKRIVKARRLRKQFAPRRRSLARARLVLRRFFRLGRKSRRYWGRNLARVRGGARYYGATPDF